MLVILPMGIHKHYSIITTLQQVSSSRVEDQLELMKIVLLMRVASSIKISQEKMQ